MSPEVTVYVDGSCSGNPGPGAWAAILQCETPHGVVEKCLSGRMPENPTTNQRSELFAAIKALTALKQPCRVYLYSDSQYLTKTMLGEYRRGKNEGLWQA